MSLLHGSARSRIPILLLFIALSLVTSATVSAQDQTTPDIVEQRATFPVTDPPDAPFQAHQSMLLFVPGAEATLHRHGGPGYITILDGDLTLLEDGEVNGYQAGQSFVETSDKLYKGGNYTEQNTALMVTYLIPEGEEVTTPVDNPEAPVPPETGPEPLAETVYEFSDPPSSFELVHYVRMFQPETGIEPASAEGEMVLTVVSGTITATIDGADQTLEASDTAEIEAGQEYVIQNQGDTESLMMSTELVPDTYSMAPDAGAPVDRAVAIWLMVMVGGAILVIGAMMRFGVVRIR